MQSEERRAPDATRIPFEGLVEVGGAMGPAFEAQAVNVSEDGMMLRTAYLPEPGQPLTCRFDTAGGQSVLAGGEVVWAEGADKGGEFAIRFTDMDPESVDALKRLCGVTAGEADAGPSAIAGSKVRLHIEGLASPMRAKVRDVGSGEVTVGSDLGFLQVGKQLELEDAQSGSKRAAEIDRVEVQVDPGSHVPQLVVRLRYAGAAPGANASAGAGAGTAGARASSGRPSPDDLQAIEDASAQMKGAVARNMARVGPALEKLVGRAKTTIALLAAKRAAAAEENAPRRTTSPAPNGGLHAAGKRVVRGEPSTPGAEEPPKRKMPTRRQAAVGGAVMLAAVLGAVALKKTHHDPAPDASATVAPEGSAAANTAPAVVPPPAAPPLAAPPPAYDPPGASPSPGSDGPSASLDDPSDDVKPSAHKKHGHATPFGNGPVHHGNVLHLKMDGPIESIEGAQQPTGFAVKLPGRKAVEAAGPLAARDARIASIKVANEGAGAQLTVAFKDGVPNYLVSAKGDTLLIALAPAAGETVANKTDSHKHRKGAAKVSH